MQGLLELLFFAVPCIGRQSNKLINGTLRLVGGISSCSGRLEIHYNGQWGTVCDDHFSVLAAIVACRQILGTHK